jgi:serine O-acetyltransferase
VLVRDRKTSPSAPIDLHTYGQPLSWSQFRSLVHEDWQTHGRDRHSPGFRAMAVHRLGNWRLSIHPPLLRAPFSVLYKALHRFVSNYHGIELPYSVVVGRRLKFEHQGGIVIHGACRIGDDCILRQNTTMGVRWTDRPTDVPVVGNGVDIGAGAVLLGPIDIGDGAAIGANAVVLHDVPRGGRAVGNPARILGPRQAG